VKLRPPQIFIDAESEVQIFVDPSGGGEEAEGEEPAGEEAVGEEAAVAEQAGDGETGPEGKCANPFYLSTGKGATQKLPVRDYVKSLFAMKGAAWNLAKPLMPSIGKNAAVAAMRKDAKTWSTTASVENENMQVGGSAWVLACLGQAL
jgi:hypothetical protein